jgi:hypothetical protein
MKNIFLTFSLGAVLLLSSCHNNQPPNKNSKLNIDPKLFVGSWVQPNPINDKEVQGFNLKEDGSAQSINMETLKVQKWVYNSNKLVLIVESIGNGVSGIDTIVYEVLKINNKELDLKGWGLIDKYTKQ